MLALITRKKMPTLQLHHYKNQTLPYVAKVVSDNNGKTTLLFLDKIQVKKSADSSYGDYQVTVSGEGFYRIGNTKPDDGGYRLFYTTPIGNKFPFIKDSTQIDDIKSRVALGETISQIVLALGL